jgi:hypothetical protein
MPLSILARFTTTGEAGSARSAVEAAGIDTALTDDEIVAITWTWSNAVGGIKLIVRDDDLQDAADVLDFPSAEPETTEESAADAVLPVDEEADQQTGAVLCPECGSAAVTRIPRLRLFLFFAAVLGGAGIALHQSQLGLVAVLAVALVTAMTPSHRCTSCMERFNARPPVTTAGPPPDASDMLEEHCPRCGSVEFHKPDFRLLQGITLLVGFTVNALLLPVMLVLLLAWPFMPRRHCDNCELNA